MEEVVLPVLQCKVPFAFVLNNELPQRSASVTAGADGTALGAAVPVPATLIHPFTFVLTVYLPATATVIEEVVAPVFHNKDPVAFVLNVELPQLLTAVTAGVAGVLPGAATPVPAKLTHPPTVAVTLYVPAVLTVIEEVVACVLHNKEPVAVVDSLEVLLQLFTTVITGAGGAEGVVNVVSVPKDEQPFNSAVTVYDAGVNPENLPLVLVYVIPSML
jgi:hypothetical protein